MIILNQDNDEILEYNKQSLLGKEQYYNGILLGYNLYLGRQLLGTFDTWEELQKEIDNIKKCTDKYYIVDNYLDL